jgi:predicted dehydrogenase
MVAALKKDAGKIAAVGYMKSHQGHYQEIARLLREGALGELKSFEASCYLSQVFGPKKGWIYTKNLSGGGMVINSTCHLLHTLHRWFGPVRAVTAECKSVHSTEVEDEATIELEFDGVKGKVHTSWSEPGYSVETSTVKIQGEAGKLESDEGGFQLVLRHGGAGYDAGAHDLPRAEFEKAGFNLSPGYGGEGYYREDEDFVRACEKRRPAGVSWEEGLHVQRVIDSVYRSEGKRVQLSEEAKP